VASIALKVTGSLFAGRSNNMAPRRSVRKVAARRPSPSPPPPTAEEDFDFDMDLDTAARVDPPLPRDRVPARTAAPRYDQPAEAG